MTSSMDQIDWGHWVLRLVALIIDGIILAIAAAIISLILAITSIIAGGFYAFVFGTGTFLFAFLWGILALLYYMILDTTWGGTIGKRVMGLRVQMLNGANVPFDKSFIRNISKIYPLFLILDWLVGIVTLGDKRQKYLDRIAGTIVIQIKQPIGISTPPPPPPPPA